MLDKTTPVQKSALILLLVGAENASKMLKNLSEDEVEKISIEIAKMKNIPFDRLSEAIEEFYNIIIANKYISKGGIEYAKDIMSRAWGHRKSVEMIKRVERSIEDSPFSLLQTVDDQQLTNFLQNEHPQTVALILANMKPKQAAKILANFPEEKQSDITYRLATMGKIEPGLIKDVEEVLQEQMGAVFEGEFRKMGGPETTAEILNSMEIKVEKNILNEIQLHNPELASNIKEFMFLFEDIIYLSDAAVQRILKEIGLKTLAIALKTVSDEFREKIYKNMSERAANVLREELEYAEPLKIAEVEKAQKQIIEIIRGLEETDEITLSPNEEGQLVE